MSRSLFLERIRINIEICCESIGDQLASTFGGMKRPLMWLVVLALLMTLRSARKGVQRMKNGGLTAGRYEAQFKPYTPANRVLPSTSTTTSGMRGTNTPPYTPGSTSTTGYGTTNTATMNYGNSLGSTYGGAAATTYGNGGSAYPGTTATTYGNVGYNNNPSTYGTSNFNTNSMGNHIGIGNGATQPGAMTSGQAPRSLSDLIDRHGANIRLMDAHLFKDYGGVHEFYGQVETLQAFEGAGVVEKVLQGPGFNKVLVVDGGGNANVAIFGKVAAAHAGQNGWKGVIIHGAIRDAKHVSETPIGCKAIGTNPNRGRATTGSKGSPLNLFGLPIMTGMWIYADKDGIAVSDSELTTGGNPGMPAAGAVGVGTGGGFSNGEANTGYGSQGANTYQSGIQGANTYQSGQAGYVNPSYSNGIGTGGMNAARNTATTYGAQMGTTSYSATGGFVGSSTNTGTYGSQQGFAAGKSTPAYGVPPANTATGAAGTKLSRYEQSKLPKDACFRGNVSSVVYISLILPMLFSIGLI